VTKKPRTKRRAEKKELKPPWSQIRREWEHKDPDAERRAQQLIEGGWGAVVSLPEAFLPLLGTPFI